MRNLVVGIDPSSRKLAAVYAVIGEEDDVQYKTKKLPQEKPEGCSIAYSWINGLVTELSEQADKVYVFVEMPVLGRGGAGSTIPQAQINGSLLAGAYDAGAEVIPVNNAKVKKEVVGRGNANKDDIKEWVKKAWLTLYKEIQTDQDLCDSAMIFVYGKKVVALREKVAKNKNLEME